MEKIQAWLNDFKGFFTSEVSKISNAQAELTEVRGKLTTAEDTVKALNATITERDTKISTLEAAASKHSEAITALNEKLTTAENRATEALAAQGMRSDEMPAGAVDGGSTKTVSQQVEALRKKLTSSMDPKEKYSLSQQIKALQSAGKN
jgi:chromosome segregation ATPase